MQLRSHLREGTRYVPLDVVRRSAETVVIDLNRQPLPDLDVEGFALLGLLEYLFDVPAVLRQLKGTVVVSYNPAERGEDDRLSHAWVNAFTTDAIEAEFQAAGWRLAQRETLGRQHVWLLQR
jgi:hypothetical protein